jgi:hypothetical protein
MLGLINEAFYCLGFVASNGRMIREIADGVKGGCREVLFRHLSGASEEDHNKLVGTDDFWGKNSAVCCHPCCNIG